MPTAEHDPGSRAFLTGQSEMLMHERPSRHSLRSVPRQWLLAQSASCTQPAPGAPMCRPGPHTIEQRTDAPRVVLRVSQLLLAGACGVRTDDQRVGGDRRRRGRAGQRRIGRGSRGGADRDE
jgi:hypothetical protein